MDIHLPEDLVEEVDVEHLLHHKELHRRANHHLGTTKSISSTDLSFPHGIEMVGNKVFVVGRGSTDKIVRIDAETMAMTVATFAKAAATREQIIYVPSKKKLYVFVKADSSAHVEIVEVDPETLAMSTVIDDTGRATTQSPGATFTANDTHFFAIVTPNASDTLIHKYLISDFSYVATATLTGKAAGHAIMFDGEFLFATSASSPAWVARINPTDMSFATANLTINASTDDICDTGDFLWAVAEGASPKIAKVRKSDLTEAVIIDVGGQGVMYSVHYDGEFIWIAESRTPGRLIRVDPNTHEVKFQDLTFNSPNEIISDRERLFITSYLDPGAIYRIAKVSLSLVTMQSPHDTRYERAFVLTRGGEQPVAGTEDVADFNFIVPFTSTITKLKATSKTPVTSTVTLQLRESFDGGETFADAAGALGNLKVDIPTGDLVGSADPTDSNTVAFEGKVLQFSIAAGAGAENLALFVVAKARPI